MHHFFADPTQVAEDTIFITGPDVNHMKHVLRMKPGEEVLISDGTGRDYTCEVEAFEPDRAVVRIHSVCDSRMELPAEIWLFQGLPKADKMELIIQKAVELGASVVVPIAESAAKQSKRSRIPQVELVMTLKEAFSFVHDREFGLCLIPYEQEKGMDAMKQALEKTAPGQKIAVFIGPEGGFDEGEIRQALEMGVCPVSLGSRILRTETAGLAILSVLMMKLEGAF